MKNAGWLFYKDYYRTDNVQSFFASSNYREFLANEQAQNINEDSKKLQEGIKLFFDKKNETLLKTHVDSDLAALMSLKETAESHTYKTKVLKTAYLGLMTGTGIAHETGLVGEFKNGFMFDYTTGMPYLPGSSVKGALRSAFPQRLLQKDRQYAETREQLLKYYFTDVKQKDESWFEQKLSTYLLSLGIHRKDAATCNFFDLAERLIFDSEIPLKAQDSNQWAGNESGVQKYSRKKTYYQDVFHDAFIIDSSKKEKYVFETDFITPHIHRVHLHLSPFTNPIPLLHIKISSHVSICFQWQLHNDLLDQDEKRDLFVYLLTLLGIGAKTNVGYGYLSV